jgi:hypothetical protein
MLKRSGELFRWARERRRQSERFTEPSIFHQLAHQWKPVVRQAASIGRVAERKGILPLYWQKATSRPAKSTDPTTKN